MMAIGSGRSRGRFAAWLVVPAMSVCAACESPTEELLSRPTSDTVATANDGGTDDDGKPELYTTCEEVFVAARAGDACQGLDAGCTRDLPCARELVRCVNGVLFFFYEEGMCAECVDDTECGFATLCIDGKCTKCTEPSACPACDEGWTYLTRNGCTTCECGPPTQCTPQGCGDPSLSCVMGAVCAAGCNRLDCCANLCADPGCPEPAPLGCAMKCDDPACEGLCRAEKCFCDAMTRSWTCYGVCAKQTGACAVP